MIAFWLGWIACILTCLSLWLLGNEKTMGWYVNIAGSGLWLIYALLGGQWSLVVVNVVISYLNVRGAMKWKAKEKAIWPPETQKKINNLEKLGKGKNKCTNTQ